MAKESATMKTAKEAAYAKAKASYYAAKDKLLAHTNYLKGIAAVRADLAAEYAAQKNKQDEAETLLSSAAEKRAAQ